MDLNQNSAFLPFNFGDTDTALSLDFFGNRGSNGLLPPSTDDGCRLVLGLGPTANALSQPKTNKLPCFSNDDSVLQLGLSGSGRSFFASTIEFSGLTDNVVDEGSTSAKRSGGYMPSLLLAPRMDTIHDPNPGPEFSQLSFETSTTTTTTTTSSEPRPHTAKRCRFSGCTKGARGATGLCIGHGGGQRCMKLGCNKGAESRTAYCKAHGGGKRCQHLGCTKSAEGKTDLCIAHGGGRRCSHQDGCSKAARGKSGLCIRHGGGKRCKMEGCSRSAEGQIGLCISHGGGRRCQVTGCGKGAQGSTMYCKGHGGGKRCVFVGCNKGAEGSTPLCKGHGGGKRCMFEGGGICPKSVHGGTSFCVAHGGGKRCSVEGCTKSARGRTDCCVRHGGGKRCKVEECGKSAQGSTEFCKAHGGGKRCTWAETKCEKFARGRSGLCAAHTSLVHGKKGVKGGSMIGPGLFRGVVGPGSPSGGSGVSSEYSRPLIPSQVLVPMSMKSTLSEMTVPEGRVHGGGLMSLLGGDLNNGM